VKPPELLIDVVAMVTPQPPTLIDEHPIQSFAVAVTSVPAGPCAGLSVGALESA
jgi:hypothetical protein